MLCFSKSKLYFFLISLLLFNQWSRTSECKCLWTVFNICECLLLKKTKHSMELGSVCVTKFESKTAGHCCESCEEA